MTKSVLQSIARLKRSLNTQIRSLSRAVEMCLITGLNWTVFPGLKNKILNRNACICYRTYNISILSYLQLSMVRIFFPEGKLMLFLKLYSQAKKNCCEMLSLIHAFIFLLSMPNSILIHFLLKTKF